VELGDALLLVELALLVQQSGERADAAVRSVASAGVDLSALAGSAGSPATR